MKSFFSMPRSDIFFLIALLAFAAFSFMPWALDSQWAGMSMLGWMMAALMVLSPTIALARIVLERKKPALKRQAGEP